MNHVTPSSGGVRFAQKYTEQSFNPSKAVFSSRFPVRNPLYIWNNPTIRHDQDFSLHVTRILQNQTLTTALEGFVDWDRCRCRCGYDV